jgi:hypothetical protein
MRLLISVLAAASQRDRRSMFAGSFSASRPRARFDRRLGCSGLTAVPWVYGRAAPPFGVTTAVFGRACDAKARIDAGICAADQACKHTIVCRRRVQDRACRNLRALPHRPAPGCSSMPSAIRGVSSERRGTVFVAASAERVSMLRDLGLGDSEGLLVTPSAGGFVRPVKVLSGVSGCGKFLHSGRLLIAHFGQWFRRASGEANYRRKGITSLFAHAY